MGLLSTEDAVAAETTVGCGKAQHKGGFMASNGTSLKWRPTLAEGIATFFFVFVGAGSVVVTGNLTGGTLDTGRLVAIALAHGLAIALLVSAIGHLSGGHINPAVTFAAIITKRIEAAQGALYIVAQLVGAVLGALLIGALIPETLGGGLGDGGLGSHALAPEVSVAQGVGIEIVLTAVLVFVVFGAAMDKRGVGVVAPLAIGLAVMVDHFVGVPLTGASMNPARTLGPALAANAWADHWVYWVGPLIGAGIAGLLYHNVFKEDAE
jgi:MIP family channel proteins